MSRSTAENLVATARDGSKVTYKTRAGYTQAAIAKGKDGWYLVAKGFSTESVRSRARTILGHYGFEVRPFRAEVQGVALNEIPEDIAAHFERKRQLSGERVARQIPLIVQVSLSGGWADIEPVPATWTEIRKLEKQGADTVACQAYHSPFADFPIAPMLRKASLPLFGGSLIGSRTR
jgi:hypothetical protein